MKAADWDEGAAKRGEVEVAGISPATLSVATGRSTHLPRLTSRVLLETVWPWGRVCFSDLQLEIANWM